MAATDDMSDVRARAARAATKPGVRPTISDPEGLPWEERMAPKYLRQAARGSTPEEIEKRRALDKRYYSGDPSMGHPWTTMELGKAIPASMLSPTGVGLWGSKEDEPGGITAEDIALMLEAAGSALMPEESPFRHGTDWRKAEQARQQIRRQSLEYEDVLAKTVASTYQTFENPELIRERLQQAMLEDAPVSIPPGEIPPGYPIESVPQEPFVSKIDETQAKTKKDIDSNRKTIEKAVIDQLARKTGVKPNTLKAALEAAGFDLTELRGKAIGNLFGEGDAFGRHGSRIDTLMGQMANSTGRLMNLNSASQDLFNIQSARSKTVAAERIRLREIEQESSYLKQAFIEEEQDTIARVNEDYYGPKGRFTIANKVGDQFLKQLEQSIEIDPFNLFGLFEKDKEGKEQFSWSKMLTTVGSFVALGAQIMASVAFEGKLPNFIMPLLFKAMDSDMEAQRANADLLRGKATAFTSLYGTFMSAYNNEVTALQHTREVGWKFADSFIESAKKRLPPDKQKYMDMIQAEVRAEGVEAAQKSEANKNAQVVSEAQSLMNIGQIEQTAKNSITSRGYSQLNALLALEAAGTAESREIEFTKDERERFESQNKFLNRTRRIKSLIKQIVEHKDIGPIEQAARMKFNEFTDKYSDSDGLQRLLSELKAEADKAALEYGKTVDPRLTNEDRIFWQKVQGTPDELSLMNLLTRAYSSEYTIREGLLGTASRIYGTQIWEEYRPLMFTSLNASPEELYERFISSAMTREEATGSDPNAAYGRLDVGMEQLDIAGAPDFSIHAREAYEGAFTTDYQALQEQFRIRQEEQRRLQGLNISGSPILKGTPLPSQNPTPEGTPIGKKRSDLKRTLVMPLDKVKISSPFGMRFHPIDKIKKMHRGIDLVAEVGSKAYAMDSGYVVHAGYDKDNGNFIVWEDTKNRKWTYSHLKDIPKFFEPGESFQSGETIAITGNTGKSTNPHLHITVRDSLGRLLDPATLMAIGA